MAPSKGRHIDFIVTTSDPNDAPSVADNKRRVRSVAALKSWPERRKKFFDQLEPSGACQSTFLIQRPETPPMTLPTRPRKRKATTSAERPTTSGDDGCARTSSCSVDVADEHQSMRGSSHVWDLSSASSTDVEPDVLKVIATQQRRRRRRVNGPEETVPPSDEVALPTPPYSPRASLSSGRADPFNCYPVNYQPWFDRILYHMLLVYGPRGWPTLRITNQEGMEWERYMTQLALTEPALFYVRLYYGSGDLVHLGVVGRDVMSWLQLQAIKAINTALCDPNRATSDALILAVGRIALFESLYGDQIAASTIHRLAQKRMIDMRGGMRAIDFPDLIKRLMRWSDRVMAMQTSTARLLVDDDQNKDFTLEQSVRVLEKWAPRERLTLEQRTQAPDTANKSNDT